ncbi:MAG: hypothetical protein JOZ38_06005 [Candidatus Eremiobacteraeota bacterium]|nr:hypothetical protein [Candidatus Eremiobacteraeota bacterium]
MLVLGLHFGHDSAVALLRDGQPLCVVEKERLNRVKHAIGLEYADVTYVLNRFSIDPSEIDYCTVTTTQAVEYIFFDPTRLRFEITPDVPPELQSGYYTALRAKGADDYLQRGARHVVDDLIAKREGRRQIAPAFQEYFRQYEAIDPAPLQVLGAVEWFVHSELWSRSRTLPQIAQTNYEATFDEGFRKAFHVPIRLTLGDRTIPGILVSHHLAHAAYAFFESDFDRAAILTHDGARDPHSYAAGMFYYAEGTKLVPMTPHYLAIGNLYDVVAERIGLSATAGAGKLMGLAAYGSPDFFDEKFVGNLFDTNERSPQDWLDTAFAEARNRGYDMSALGIRDRMTEPINANVAASVQRIFEESLLKAVDALASVLKIVGKSTDRLCLSGGTALNCPANTRVYEESAFNRPFVPPGVADSGLALGSAYVLYHCLLEQPRKKPATDADRKYLSFSYDTQEIEAELRRFSGIVFEKVDCPERDAAEAIAENRVIAWFDGRAELGPRALGHRSILADARDAANWDRVNRIKGREWWRPLAPAVLASDYHECFSSAPPISPYMLFNADVVCDAVPAVTHVDGTARIQTVDEHDGAFFRLLNFFKDITGTSIVLNTSFNGPGEPIVETPKNALDCFVARGLDALYIGGFRVVASS